MWSLGNESGCGKNHRAMNKYIKSREPRAIIHYENAHLEFKAVPEGEDFRDISDVEIKHSFLNRLLSYNEWRIFVTFVMSALASFTPIILGT